MAKKKSVFGDDKKRVALWDNCLEQGWSLGTSDDTLVVTGPKKETLRLFFGEKDLTFQQKVPTTDEDKKTAPHKNAKWIVLERGKYTNVDVVDGGLKFKDSKKKTGVADSETPQQKKEK